MFKFIRNYEELIVNSIKDGNVFKTQEYYSEILKERVKYLRLINYLQNDGMPIYNAIKNNHKEMIFFLYDILKNKNIMYGNNHIIYYLISFNKKYNYESIIKTLIEKKEININTINSQGNSFLHCAVMQNSIEIVNFLIDNYIDITFNQSKDTPASLAIVYGYFDIYDKINNYQNKLNSINSDMIKDLNNLIKSNGNNISSLIQPVIKNADRKNNFLFKYDLIPTNDTINDILLNIESIAIDFNKNKQHSLKHSLYSFKETHNGMLECGKLKEINDALDKKLESILSNDNMVTKIKKILFNKNYEINKLEESWKEEQEE